MSDHRDSILGRAAQKTEIVATVEEQKTGIDVSKLPLELLLELKEAYATQRASELGHSDGDQYLN